MKKVVNIFFWIIISLIMIYSSVIIIEKLIWKDKIPNIFGYKSFIVLSGSMEPTFTVGDIVVVKQTNDIKENDIVTFKENNAIITHRVVEIVAHDNHEAEYVTKGDANPNNDIETVEHHDIEGKYIFKISKIGNAILFLKTRNGIFLLLIIFSIGFWMTNRKNETTED